MPRKKALSIGVIIASGIVGASVWYLLAPDDIEVVIGPSADTRDRAAVTTELASIPRQVLAQLEASGISVMVCRENVTKCFPYLATQHPEGWPKCATWKEVPGAYIPAAKTVVVSTIDSNGLRKVMPARIPQRGEAAHGSFSLAVHETIHGFDAARGMLSSKRSFRASWERDRPSIQQEYNKQYYLNETWGPRESLAESGARVYGVAGGSKQVWPNLTSYWRDLFADFSLFSGPPQLDDSIAAFDPRAPIGTGFVEPSGRVRLYLVARGRGGEIGEALLTYSPGDHSYEAMQTSLAPAISLQDSAQPAGGRSFLVMPFTHREYSLSDDESCPS